MIRNPSHVVDKIGGDMLHLVNGRSSYWLRGICAGGLFAVLCTLVVGLAIAAARDEQPFRRGKLVPSDAIDATANVGIPVAAVVGALLGVGWAERIWRAKSRIK